MKILITGATGFIGRSLVNALRVKHELLLVSRQPDQAARLLAVDKSQVCTLEQLENLSGFDAVINLAGESLAAKRWTFEQRKKISESRWCMTEQLLIRLQRSADKPKIWLNASAVGYYGPHGTELIDESFQIAPHRDFAQTVCFHWEELAQAARSYGCRVCIMRFGLVLDASGGVLTKMLPAYKLGLGGKLGSGEQMFPWIALDDVIAGIQFLLERNYCSGIYNFTAPDSVTQAEFSESLAGVLRRPHLLSTPACLLYLVFGDMAQLLLTGQHAIPKHLLQDGFTFAHGELLPTLQKMLKPDH
jgi:uncharacterized protein (TIGR01777 family)